MSAPRPSPLRPAAAPRALIFGLCWALLGSLLACSGGVPRPENFSDDPAPLLASIEARERTVRSLTGLLNLEVWRKGERVRLRQLVAVRSPDQVRLDALSPFEQPLSTLVSDGQTLSIYDLQEHRFLRGPSSPENLARLLPVPLEPEALTALLRGNVPVLAAPKRRTLTWDRENGWYQLDLERDDLSQRIHFEPQKLRVTALRFARAGETLLSARLGDYQGEGAEAIPRRLRLEAPAQAVRVEVEVKDYTLNPELPDEVFWLDPPRGIEIEVLD